MDNSAFTFVSYLDAFSSYNPFALGSVFLLASFPFLQWKHIFLINAIGENMFYYAKKYIFSQRVTSSQNLKKSIFCTFF